ncbi:MAG: DUF1573 domain-containing protein [Candidatus Zixiibacteriota bacterium]
MNPAIVTVNQTDDNRTNEASFTITNVSDTPLELAVVSQPPGYFTLNVPDKIESGKSADCRVKINAQYLSESFQKSLTFEFSDISKTRFTVPIVQKIIKGGKTAQAPASGH